MNALDDDSDSTVKQVGIRSFLKIVILLAKVALSHKVIAQSLCYGIVSLRGYNLEFRIYHIAFHDCNVGAVDDDI